MQQKTLYIIARANGSGKTTFAKQFAELENLDFINADEIAKELGSLDVYKNPMEVGRVFFNRLNRKLEGSDSFVIETTLSGKYLIKVISGAKDKGFKIVLLYLFLEDCDENILRVKHRVLTGGHNVPEADIIRRYYRSIKMFWGIYKSLVDEWHLYYNGDDKFELISNNNDTVDEILFEKFMEKL